MVKLKPIKNPKHGQVTAFARDIVRRLDDKILEEDNRTTAVTYVSVLIQRQFPVIQRETRRQLAAKCLEEERKRRRDAIP